MAFDLARIRQELAAAPLASPPPWDLAVAVVNDCLRSAGRRPIPSAAWVELLAKRELREEQIAMLAHILSTTSLRAETIAAMRALAPGVDAAERLELFFAAIAPLTAEMIRANQFRQEECLRRWIVAWGGSVQGESVDESNAKLEQLDYRKALAEYERAERARKAEAEKRAQALKEALEREAAARGWRE